MDAARFFYIALSGPHHKRGILYRMAMRIVGWSIRRWPSDVNVLLGEYIASRVNIEELKAITGKLSRTLSAEEAEGDGSLARRMCGEGDRARICPNCHGRNIENLICQDCNTVVQ